MNHHFVEEAIQQALKSPMKDKYGAVLVYRNKIISKGFNTYSPHTLGATKQCVL